MPAQIAAGTLPRAMEVKAIEDWMVEGTRQRKSSPSWSCGVRTYGTSPYEARPSSGKSANVHSTTARWSRQWRRPSRASRVESRAP
ncbi:hypothetical protein GCM10009801_65200 [Streptomyces albiaxialis]|uniref:Uncharacterized protein n=1 Tax=Streptomyces albiaxialis TaxID=329523 RepID=A0ABN2WNS2_9ACTN